MTDGKPAPWPDWRNAAAYAFTERLTREQWPWEFLRRNPDYRREWAAFMTTWLELEAAYGRPPNRNFTAWRQDPRAWVLASHCASGECRIDQDRILIECALGARFGFHKFPPDPADDDPVGAGRLVWRERPAPAVQELGPPELARLSARSAAEPAQMILAFDLSRPLRAQLEQAKRHLQMAQRLRVREGRLTLATVAGLRGRWTCALRLLDGESAGTTGETLAQGLASGCGGDQRAALGVEARRLRDGGYLDILDLPEG